MELKKIFPKWWHPAVITAIFTCISVLAALDKSFNAEPFDVFTEIMWSVTVYIASYIGFVFWRTGYYVLKDIFAAYIK